MRTLATEIRLVKNKYHVQSLPSFLYSKHIDVDPGVQELEALIDTIQKQLKDHPWKENMLEAFQTCDKEASGYVDKEMFFKICDSLNVPIDDSLIKEVSVRSSSGLIVKAEQHLFSLESNCVYILF